MSNLAPHRNTIFSEDAEIISHEAFAGEQYVLRLQAPKIAANAQPGSFVHLRCAELLPMRRPISIMRVDANKGYVDLLYKALGHGTRLLAERKVGEVLSVMGPIGRPFAPGAARRRPVADRPVAWAWPR